MSVTPEVLRERAAGDDPIPPAALVQEPQGEQAPAPGLLGLAQNLYGAQQQATDARNRAVSTLETKAAAMEPAVEGVQKETQRIGDEAMKRQQALDTLKPVLTAPPSRQLRGFLAPSENEAPEASVSKFITAVGLFATGIGGLAAGDARGSLAALTGALTGWQKGDREAADRQFADWQAKTQAALKAWEIERASYEDWFKAANISIEQMMRGLTLEAMKHDNKAAVEVMRAGNFDAEVKFFEERDKAAREVATLMATIEAQRAAQKSKDDQLRVTLLTLEETMRHNRATEEQKRLEQTFVKPEEVDRLRDDFTKASGTFVTVRDAYTRVLESAKQPTAAGDLALIYSYMKMLDPGSVVRESEFAQAASAGSYGEQIQAAVQRALNGQRLADTVRADFVNRAGRLFAGTVQTQEELENTYRGLAGQRGVPEARVIIDYPGRMRDEAKKVRAGQKETLSRLDPVYRKARARGLTDEQINKQFGVTVVD